MAGEPLLVLLSGGADSVCLLDVAIELEAGVAALHVNHGLREGADADEEFCRELCERLGVPLTVERAAGPPEGNVEAWARELRYAAAERTAEGDYATGHTLSDQAETVVYRLATSPGPACAARHGAAARAAGQAAARGDARGHARLVPRARARVA